MRVTKLTAMLLALSLLAFTPAYAENAPDEYKALLQQMHFTDNLKLLGIQIAKATQTYQMVAAKVGAEKADTLLNEKIAATLPKYQDQWDTNLAASYQKYVTLDDLHALKKDGTGSPAYKKLMEQENNIGEIMHEKSHDILNNLATDVLSEMFSETSKL